MVPLVRAFVSLPAGMARMPFVRFTVLSTIGSIPWVLALALAGHALGGNWTTVRKYFEYVDYAIVALALAAVVYAVLRRRRGGGDAGGQAEAVDQGATGEPAAAEQS